jgi:hypothetical protein
MGAPSKTTLRFEAAFAGTLPLRPAASAWWVPPGHLLGIAQADTQPSRDLKRSTLKH